MKKNKLLVIAIAAMISMSSIVPAYAAEAVSQDPTSSKVTSEVKQTNEAEKLAKFTERATKLGVDITGLTNEQAREKIKGAVALKLGVDITGLSKEDSDAKIQAAREAKKLEIAEKISQKATKLGIDITGLSNIDARTKLREAVALKLGVDITGLSKEDAKAKIQAAREAKKKEVTEKITEKAAKFGVDITGLTNKEAKEKIKAAREEAKAAKTTKLVK